MKRKPLTTKSYSVDSASLSIETAFQMKTCLPSRYPQIHVQFSSISRKLLILCHTKLVFETPNFLLIFLLISCVGNLISYNLFIECCYLERSFLSMPCIPWSNPRICFWYTSHSLHQRYYLVPTFEPLYTYSLRGDILLSHSLPSYIICNMALKHIVLSSYLLLIIPNIGSGSFVIITHKLSPSYISCRFPLAKKYNRNPSNKSL